MRNTPSSAGVRLITALVVTGAAAGALAVFAPSIASVAGVAAMSSMALAMGARLLIAVRTWRFPGDAPYFLALVSIVIVVLIGLGIGGYGQA